MKNIIFETKLTTAAEHLAQVLREYSGKPMRCDITVHTHEDEIDKYYIVAYFTDENNAADETALTIGARIYYEDGTDKITRIAPFYREADEYDPQGKT